MDPPDPVEAIKFRMEQQSLTRKDLEPLIGTRTRVAEILNRRRNLSIGMIRRLHARLGISAEILIGPTRNRTPLDSLILLKEGMVRADGEGGPSGGFNGERRGHRGLRLFAVGRLSQGSPENAPETRPLRTAGSFGPRAGYPVRERDHPT